MEDPGNEEFVHQIAVRLSRMTNLTNPNDLLARRVIGMATANDTKGFIQG
jgi:pre-mRNA-splicing factor ATP-dependent RNA helicase DHX38/PRP16